MYPTIFGALLMVAFHFPGLDLAPERSAAPSARYAESTNNASSDVDRAVGWIRDSWMTAQIELRLLTNRDVNVTDVHVQTHDGVVTLEGTVPSQDSRMAAQDDARRVDGVKQVINHLRITSEAAPANPSSGSL